jgi:hypothetical protein
MSRVFNEKGTRTTVVPRERRNRIFSILNEMDRVVNLTVYIHDVNVDTSFEKIR